MLNPRDLASILAQHPEVPTMSAVAGRVLSLASDEGTTTSTLARVITADPGLTAKLLKLANSSFYANQRKTTKITDALVVLGTRAVRNLVLGVSVLDVFGKGAQGSDPARALWERTLNTAVLARALAARVRLDGEEAFVLGLLADVGLLGVVRFFPKEYEACAPTPGRTAAQVLDAERKMFGIDHPTAGRLMAQRWNLPAAHAQAIAVHHDPLGAAGAGHVDLQRVLAAAASLVHALYDERRFDTLERARREVVRSIGISLNALEEDLAVLPERVAEVVAQFELEIEAPASYLEVVLRANEQLADLNQRYEETTRQLEEANRKLAEIASKDGLTGVANRRSFDEALAREAARAGRHGSRLVLAMGDVDYFKRCNDSYGHQTGDEVLCAVATLLARSFRSSDLVARYGGEEFAILILDTDLPAAALAIDRIRARLAALPFTTGDRSFHVTASFGLAAFDPLNDAATPGLLVQRADAMLYKAKQTGRDRVCWDA